MRRYVIKIYIKWRYLKGKVVYYFNLNVLFNVEIIRVGDVELNLGDIRNFCLVCGKLVVRSYWVFECLMCKL